MAYKTLMLQLYKPSRSKRALMDAALLHYSQALQALMTRCRDNIETLAEKGARIMQRQLLSLIDKETAKSLNEFHVQPFKDSLKIEFAALAEAYIEQKRASGGAGYPLAYLDPSCYSSALSDCIARFDSGKISRTKFESACSKLTDRVGRPRSLYFGRYSINRDYCLLYDEFKDRFYAKLYLLNASDGYCVGDTVSGLSLRYVAAGLPAMLNQAGKRRYIVAPLAFGKKQYGDLKAALEDPDRLHTARLLKKGKDYYLMVSLKCESAPVLETVSALGVSKGFFGGLNYVICGLGGEILKRGRIAAPPHLEQAAYIFSKRVVKIASENRSQVILEANGGKNDRLPPCGAGASSLSGGQYALLADVLKYKLPEKRLPPPIEVSANGLFFTCPRCQNRTRRNRISDGLFACVKCGYASELEWIGCENLAGRLLKYGHDKVPVTVLKKDNTYLFYIKNLEFEFSLPGDAENFEPMYDELNRYLRSLGGKFQRDSKKYAVWKKLRQAPDVRDAVRLILK